MTHKSKKIEKLAQHALEKAGFAYAPVDVVHLAKFYGFSVYNADLKKISATSLACIDEGFVSKFGASKVIVVNKHLSEEKMRFAVACELAHYFLNNKPQKKYGHKSFVGAYGPEERDARQFAAVLLMPEIVVKAWFDQARRVLFYDEIFVEAARRFCVPQNVAQSRIGELGLSLNGGVLIYGR